MLKRRSDERGCIAIPGMCTVNFVNEPDNRDARGIHHDVEPIEQEDEEGEDGSGTESSPAPPMKQFKLWRLPGR